MIATVTIRHVRDVAFVSILTLALAGCFSSGQRAPAPIQAAPSAPVRSAELAPPPQPQVPEAPVAEQPLPEEQEQTQVASAPASSSVSVGRTDLLGGWTLSSAGETCQLFMSLTTWTGGYRASTRGCSSQQLSGISAWDLSGNTVTLKSGDGATTVATLSATQPQQFSGTTSGGSGITVSR
ncbi:AprI/Inh family metalloprotease inhibitor [Acuticoccus sp. M5D2P5]|uniref:AprI/Inh family metalloprotease inhibitor n=1 Tax=Acuticoccus kalidii TaxID=2910977 RepID=UPI001F2994DA|nr:AprI/Inh family metalloprotease inhibitor [Acuticoccus kalidii]MCF3936015.1 AprI/Inh family metalloprotease inhibitor [Acuticoccus kalidii]